MAEIIWTMPSLNDLDNIADYVALDKPGAAARFVVTIFDVIERLADHPFSGKPVEELPNSPYREIVVPPCRIVYRPEKDVVYILHAMRGERLFRDFLLKERDQNREGLEHYTSTPDGKGQ